MARQHPGAEHRPRARDPGGQGAGARDRRRVAGRSIVCRQLPSDLATGIRRHGRSVAGEAPAPRPSRGGEADSAGNAAGRRAGTAGPPFPARSAGHGPAAVAAYRAALRLRRQRHRRLLLRHGAAPGSRPAAHREPLRTSGPGTGDHAPPPGVPLACRGARTRPRAPRHQAREPFRRPVGHRVRLLESARLRDREGAARLRSGRIGSDAAHLAEPRPGHTRVHGARDRLCRGLDRRPDRSLLPGVRRLLGAHGAAGLPGEHPGADAAASRANAAGVAVRGLGASGSTRPGSIADAVSREGSGEKTLLGARARSAACPHPLPGCLDARPRSRVVECARPGRRCLRSADL